MDIMVKNILLTRLSTFRLVVVFIFVGSLLMSNGLPIMVHTPKQVFGQIILQGNRYSYSEDINYNGNSNGGGYSMGLDGHLTIPDYPTIPGNQNPIITKNALSGTQIPKNLIIGPSCAQSCPPIIGTQKDDMIYATTVADALVYSLK